jgi:hypothetical protein
MPNLTTIRSVGSQYRPVAFGVSIAALSNYTTTQGVLHICEADDVPGNSSWTYPTSLAQMQQAPSYQRVTLPTLLSEPILVRGKYSSASDAFSMHATGAASTYSGYESGLGWKPIILAISGATVSSYPLDYTLVVHYELTPNSVGGTLAGLGTKAAFPDSKFMDMVTGSLAAVSNLAKGVSSTDIAGVGEFIAPALMTAAKFAMAA